MDARALTFGKLGHGELAPLAQVVLRRALAPDEGLAPVGGKGAGHLLFVCVFVFGVVCVMLFFLFFVMWCVCVGGGSISRTIDF